MAQEIESGLSERPPQSAEMLDQAVGQIDLAQFWAKHNRPDLVSAFTSMAKLMLAEGHGVGSESEFWVLTTRSANAGCMEQPELALKCAIQAHILAEHIFAGHPAKLAVACGTLGQALFLNNRPEEARKWLSQGIFGLSGVSHKLPAGTSEKLAKYYSESFVAFVRTLQELPARPRQQ